MLTEYHLEFRRLSIYANDMINMKHDSKGTVEDWMRSCSYHTDCGVIDEDRLTEELKASQAEWARTTSQYMLRRLEQVAGIESKVAKLRISKPAYNVHVKK